MDHLRLSWTKLKTEHQELGDKIMIPHEVKSKLASETAQHALIKATQALTMIEQHEKTCSVRWYEVNRRTTHQGRLQLLVLGKILAIIILLVMDRVV